MGALVEGGFFILQNIVQGGDAVATARVAGSEGGRMREGGGGVGGGKWWKKKEKEYVDGRKVQGRWYSPRIGSPENNANTVTPSTCGGWS